MGETLTPVKVFVTIVLLQSIRLDMTNFFPKAAQWLSESQVSLKRIQDFMLMTGMAEAREAKDDAQVFDKESTDTEHPIMVSIDKAFFNWPKANVPQRTRSESLPLPLSLLNAQELVPLAPERHVLSDITLQIKKGELIGVCGIVGAGKSSLLNTILGELQPTSGKMSIRTRSIGYTSQSAWLMSGTLKDNILFGAPYDEDRFKKVVTACALDRDLELFPRREETFIGERGVTLSGGQRARLALARAVYFDADIYLLDDPLSAVDSKVGSHLFDECIRGLLRDKVCSNCPHLLSVHNKSN
jgi:ATP-binding cassette subfamily C (CFTR/MRP) protein 4